MRIKRRKGIRRAKKKKTIIIIIIQVKEITNNIDSNNKFQTNEWKRIEVKNRRRYNTQKSESLARIAGGKTWCNCTSDTARSRNAAITYMHTSVKWEFVLRFAHVNHHVKRYHCAACVLMSLTTPPLEMKALDNNAAYIQVTE